MTQLVRRLHMTSFGGNNHVCLRSHVQIKTGSIAEKLGLKVRDIVVKINNESTGKMTSQDAEAIVVKGENQFVMMIER